jgi:hypothetical protein
VTYSQHWFLEDAWKKSRMLNGLTLNIKYKIMSKEKLFVGEISTPRFEFRTFGRDFEEAAYLMSRLSVPVPQEVRRRRSSETYIISRTNDVNNIKIRDGKMDMKTLVQEIDGLEQWNPVMKAEFPMKAEILKSEVFPAFQVEMHELDQDNYTIEEFLTIVKTHPRLQAVSVEKERFGYMINDTICEYANVWINGAMVVTVNSESTELDDIKKTIKDLGLEGIENINYLQAVKRVVGMIDKELAN